MISGETVCEVVGWYGAIGVLGAFALNTFNRIRPRPYHFINMTAGFSLAYMAWCKDAVPLFVLNTTWGVIAAIALVASFRAKPDLDRS